MAVSIANLTNLEPMPKIMDTFSGNKPTSVFSYLLTALLLAVVQPLAAQQAAENTAKPAKLFERNDTLDVTITAPWQDIKRKEKFEGAYPAKIEYTDELGNSVTLDLTVERRGITRQEICDLPPIKLRFDPKSAKGSTFRGQKSLKMVTHCKSNSRFEQYYIMEMLVYRMYNLVNDFSFRVRALNINYADSKTGKLDGDRFAFLIEDDSDVAKRHDLKKLVIPKIKPSRLEARISSEFSLFQYMIGNVDWAALSGPDPKECCHNVKLIAPRPLEPDDLIYPVPYDFDSSGIINTDYAAPPNGLPIRSVTQRLFRGYCVHNSTLEDARQHLLTRESEIHALVNGENRLKSGTQKKVNRYLDKFFEIIKDPRDFEKLVISKCRK